MKSFEDMTLADIEALALRWVAEARLPRERAEAEALVRALPYRLLGIAEIKRLEQQGNCAIDWADVRVTENFDPSRVWRNCFEGRVTIAAFEPVKHGARAQEAAIHDCVLRNSIISPGTRLVRVGALVNCLVASGACIERVGRIGLSAKSAKAEFGNGQTRAAREFVRRAFPVAAELPFALIAWVAGPQGADPANARLVETINDSVRHYVIAISAERGFVGKGAMIMDTTAVEDCFIGESSVIDGAARLTRTTLAGAIVQGAAHLDGVLAAHGCRITGPCTVNASQLGSDVEIGAHAFVKNSALATGCRIRCGEVHDSVVGPRTFALHQSALLCAWWPEGRGNISYGSNVGSNHTGRAPDQEIFPGEGTFFGLGCNVKMPLNFRGAPHSMIASGLTLLPQRMSLPFSLIMQPERVWPELSPAIHEIRPGWVLRHNAYGIERHEQSGCDKWDAPIAPILRPALLDLCARAAERLRSVEGKALYTDRDLPELGKNFMTEAARVEAIAIYEESMMIGATRLLMHCRDGEGKPAPWFDAKSMLPWLDRVLDLPGMATDTVRRASAREFAARWLELVKASRAKDWARGCAVIDDYALRHDPLEKDHVVMRLEAKVAAFR